MHPYVFSLGPLAVTSFGLFLSLAFFASAFVCWRLGRTYDFEENKTLDLIILTFLGGIIGARVLFVALNPGEFDELYKIILLNRYPGLSFWGGLLGGAVFLKVFTYRLKLNFWQTADFAVVGLTLGMVLGNIGCFLSGCSYGVVSNLPIAAPVVGILGKRFPVTLVESLALLFIFFYLWGQVVKFHFTGKIAALFLIFIGIIKFTAEFGRGDIRLINIAGVSFGHIFSILLATLGLVAFYRLSKRSVTADLRSLKTIMSSGKKRKTALVRFQKNWYNYQVDFKIKIGRAVGFFGALPKFLRRKLNVRPTPKNFF